MNSLNQNAIHQVNNKSKMCQSIPLKTAATVQIEREKT